MDETLAALDFAPACENHHDHDAEVILTGVCPACGVLAHLFTCQRTADRINHPTMTFAAKCCGNIAPAARWRFAVTGKFAAVAK